jgi:hypothetical protein
MLSTQFVQEAHWFRKSVVVLRALGPDEFVMVDGHGEAECDVYVDGV